MLLLLLSCIRPSDDGLSENEDIDWQTADIDQDGWSLADGDCWEDAVQPPQVEGAEIHNLSSKDIYPGAVDIPYDGIDANCDGRDDFDADGDGFVPERFNGIQTFGLEDQRTLPDGDCWDQPIQTPPDFVSLNGFSQLSAEDIYPGVADIPYDGINQDCGSEAFEFDVDHDGENSMYYSDRNGQYGFDCIDNEQDLLLAGITEFTPNQINSFVSDTWYDGVDQNCDGSNDYDQDGDGFEAEQYGGNDCNDLRVEVSPEAEEYVADNFDQNCDGVELCYIDHDDDGYGAEQEVLSVDLNCMAYGVANNSLDCNDLESGIYPNAPEECDGLDTDCDGNIPSIEIDNDGDGFSECEGDCQDLNGSIYPFAPETPNMVDANCDGFESLNYSDCTGDSFQGTYFLYCEDNLTANQAHLFCRNHGYDGLASIRTSQEDNFIANNLNIGFNFAWIGLNDQLVEGAYRWRDNQPLSSYRNWSTNQPNNSNNEDCVAYKYLGWSELNCSLSLDFICQKR